MMGLFKKLDRIADRLIANMDGELHGPVMRAVTGEVFTHGADNHHRSASPAVIAQTRTDSVQRPAHELCDAVADTLNPPLTVPLMPQSGISTQVT